MTDNEKFRALPTLPLCDRVYVLNNSSADNPFQQVAAISSNYVNLQQHTMPDWARELLADYLMENSWNSWKYAE
ncbi:hypothetical protein [Nitrosomonas ureae]|uniref:Uncharacterized protein n=1 Tax=Nitrosomonas ureae TaxID=44577 RepID=A0A1H5UT19_9PROT|nr:hypothetical protein [Nitrosomonas ureae]SEF78156.1 hypothetical protein SAMN05216334_10940 [Nitrosomonas ureae]